MSARICSACDKEVFPEQPDPCWGALPGVKFACCGHGGEGPSPDAYIVFENDVAVYFKGPVEVSDVSPILVEQTYGGPPKGWTTRWYCDPPECEVGYRVIWDEWSDDETVRSIYKVEVV